ncbi:hypothetical protein COLO4_17206 [Corchorus olitorius]|uniref:DUF642 domain-containing protein n=1 Tax=Corchorus olitorius TaxID=93759 RepID=A0A1R3JDM8_9ROSI|nr:hypothetical protein COLO4_17206 [Corchorus olitorius]
MQPQIQIFFLLFLFLVGFAAAGNLQNPDFESPPKNVSADSSNPFVTLNENNTIPGWTFQGTVSYVTAGPNISLPDNGHAIQLGEDGKINQTFNAGADFMNYILTFTLIPGGQNCSANANLLVSGSDTQGIYSFKQHYGKEAWQSYGLFLGLGGQEEPINLVFESQPVESVDNSTTCWPVIDSLLLKSVETLVQGKDNLLLNGGFEFGPEFLSNSTEGILLDSALSPVQSPLRHWAVVGTVKYIDSKHFFVPHGNAAVEIVSGVSAGIHTELTLTSGSSYNLEFTLGDANDACEGEFIVQVQAGSVVQNFTVRSNGTGLAQKSSLKFDAAGSRATPIGFLSYTTIQTKDGILCGPVIDDVVLLSSSGSRMVIKLNILISLLLFLILIL